MPISSTCAAIDSYLDETKEDLRKMRYGEVGVIFVVVDGEVVRVKRICSSTYQMNGHKLDMNKSELHEG